MAKKDKEKKKPKKVYRNITDEAISEPDTEDETGLNMSGRRKKWFTKQERKDARTVAW